MSAVRVAEVCYDRYHAIQALPAEMRQDIDAIAGHFYAQSPSEFEKVFLSLVPWNDLVGEPNGGHAALGDFLISGTACAVLSANFDTLIEQWGNRHKIAMRGALTGQEASNEGFCPGINPLLKFHGCMDLDRGRTLWTAGQLSDPTVSSRVESCSQWMGLNLPGKDLLVVGFWTDWGYLNDVLVNAIKVQWFGSVTVIDPKSTQELEEKAPTLWATLSDGALQFEHVRGSGTEALEELRAAFSKVWMRRFYAMGQGLVEAEGKPYVALEPPTDGASLYDCRRDAEGVPNNRAAQLREPPPHAEQAAYFHHLIAEAAEAREGSWYVLHGRRVRVLQGCGRGLTTIRQQFNESPAIVQPDVVVCAGALDVPVPGRLVATGQGNSIVRAGRGGSAKWMTDEQAKVELGLGRPIVTGGHGQGAHD